MKMCIPLLLLASGLMASGCATAQPSPASSPSTAPALDVSPFVGEVDKDHDGCITANEWYGLGLPQSAHDMLQDTKGCITVASMKAVAPPPGIDTNRDGKLTLAEFQAFKGPAKEAGASSKP